MIILLAIFFQVKYSIYHSIKRWDTSRHNIFQSPRLDQSLSALIFLKYLYLKKIGLRTFATYTKGACLLINIERTECNNENFNESLSKFFPPTGNFWPMNQQQQVLGTVRNFPTNNLSYWTKPQTSPMPLSGKVKSTTKNSRKARTTHNVLKKLLAMLSFFYHYNIFFIFLTIYKHLCH